ncbi:hypothetical protein HPB47_011384, partial [Ixodes persulcatus]
VGGGFRQVWSLGSYRSSPGTALVGCFWCGIVVPWTLFGRTGRALQRTCLRLLQTEEEGPVLRRQ